MNYRRVGSSGLIVSELTYGNWITHGGQIGDDDARRCVTTALDCGINTFDTADVYSGTRAESVLGRCLSGVRREGLVICTKVFEPIGDGPNDRGLSRKHVIEGCTASLRRLGMDYVDILYAHRDDRETPLEETFLAFADLVRSGRVLYVGISEWASERIAQAAVIALDLKVPLIASQPQYSLLHRRPEGVVFPVCEALGIGQLVWSPLAQGILTGKYRSLEIPPPGSRLAYSDGEVLAKSLVGHWLRYEVLDAVHELEVVAADWGFSLPRLAVSWVLRSPRVASAIVGASRPEHLIETTTASGSVVPEDLVSAAEKLLAPFIVRA